MYFPELYLTTNTSSTRDAAEILKKYSHFLKWRPDQQDTLLDIGCGPGDITHDIILPVLPSTFTKIVGADISEEMIEYAKKKFVHPKLEFCLIDIGDRNVKKYFPNNERFDHIMSIFCLHRITNQELVMKNIYDLLHTNGDCLLLIIGYCSMYDAYPKLAGMEKWSKYMKDYKLHISPYHYEPNVEEKCLHTLKYGGFKNYKIEILENQSYNCVGVTEAKKNLMAINAFVHRVPDNQKDEFINDQMKYQFPDVTKEQESNWPYEIKYTLIVVYANK